MHHFTKVGNDSGTTRLSMMAWQYEPHAALQHASLAADCCSPGHACINLATSEKSLSRELTRLVLLMVIVYHNTLSSLIGPMQKKRPCIASLIAGSTSSVVSNLVNISCSKNVDSSTHKKYA